MSHRSSLRFLVVGASGFIGCHLMHHIRSRGFDAFGTSSATMNLLTDRIADVIGDFRPTHTIIAAVISNMDRCLAEREMSYRVNVTNTIRLIEDVRSMGSRPVFLSTNFVFDGSVGCYNEEAPISPVNEYGRHKAEVEGYLRANVPEGLVTRLSTNVGDNPGEAHLFSQWYQLLIENKPIVCIDGAMISPTYVEDVAHALVTCCERKITGLFHLANTESFYRNDLALKFCDAFGKKANIIRKPLREFGFLDNRALKADLDSSKFVHTTGLSFTPMGEVIRRFIENVRLNQ
ncbi:MAG: sugar nucleotide-binding protein [Verrucomicrobia bacterium]|nr:sugar nucleotide-binding protein [Verrucomicrobiota bacterium]